LQYGLDGKLSEDKTDQRSRIRILKTITTIIGFAEKTKDYIFARKLILLFQVLRNSGSFKRSFFFVHTTARCTLHPHHCTLYYFHEQLRTPTQRTNNDIQAATTNQNHRSSRFTARNLQEPAATFLLPSIFK